MANCQTNILDLPLSVTAPLSTDVVMFTNTSGDTVIRTWGTVNAGTSPTDIEFEVGQGGGYPNTGDSTFQDDSMIGKRVRLFRNNIKQSLADRSGYHYTFNSVSGTITFTPNLTDEELIQIEIY